MELDEIRKKIDLLDSRILRILNDRMELALMAKKLKTIIEDKDREKEIIERIRLNSTGLINSEFVENVYSEVLKESKALQNKEHELIGFQGEHGAYGEVALREWNKEWVSVPCKGFATVFEGIKKGNYCIIAYQDKNKNGNIDRLLGGHIIEPRGLYKESIMEPCWKNMSFKLEQNLKNVEIAISDSGY